MSETVNPRPPRNVSDWALGGFVAYFALILPALAWGLWTLITDNTFVVPGSAALNTLPATSTARDTAAFLAASQQTRLVLDQGELMLAVMLAGGIGSYIHGVNSFVSYAGNRSFVASWMPWYLLRPFMGVAMAVIFYVVVRGGVLVMSGGVNAVDPYAMMTVAALAGMFSKQASDKLAEVFDTLFRSRADQERGDKLEKPELRLAAIAPAEVVAGATEMVITATGTGFARDAVVRVNGTDRVTAFKSATELAFTLLEADAAAAGAHAVSVFNPGAPGTTSNELKLTVAPVQAGGTTIQVPALVTENANGGVEVVSVADNGGEPQPPAGDQAPSDGEATVASGAPGAAG